MQEHVKREKHIMAECSCPFLVNLVAAFNEGPYLYLLIECIMGGELFTYLQVCLQLCLAVQVRGGKLRAADKQRCARSDWGQQAALPDSFRRGSMPRQPA